MLLRSAVSLTVSLDYLFNNEADEAGRTTKPSGNTPEPDSAGHTRYFLLFTCIMISGTGTAGLLIPGI